jgi:hypothetical protein
VPRSGLRETGDLTVGPGLHAPQARVDVPSPATPALRFKDARHEAIEADSKSLRERDNLDQGRVSFSPFDSADVVSVAPTAFGQGVLRESQPCALLSDVGAKTSQCARGHGPMMARAPLPSTHYECDNGTMRNQEATEAPWQTRTTAP